MRAWHFTVSFASIQVARPNINIGVIIDLDVLPRRPYLTLPIIAWPADQADTLAAFRPSTCLPGHPAPTHSPSASATRTCTQFHLLCLTRDGPSTRSTSPPCRLPRRSRPSASVPRPIPAGALIRVTTAPSRARRRQVCLSPCTTVLSPPFRSPGPAPLCQYQYVHRLTCPAQLKSTPRRSWRT